ncbi:transketolase [bacterium]|nr:transketolase [bacterium]MBU0899729.1 transketolase [bacterium]MBU1153098.1 transketolase [bacterium]MBU1782711.1 transketolase [bacterium]
MNHFSIEELKNKVQSLKKKLIDLTYQTGGAYLAQALSGVDLMAALFYRYLKYDPLKPNWEERDRFLLSPGHYALLLYTILADLGYFDPKLLSTFKENNSPLELISHRHTLPGVEISGGSLGQVLSVGVGMALHAKLRKKKHRIFVMMSDGEQNEGQIWEAATSAVHFKLNNLVALIDKNGFQVDGPTKEVMNMEPLGDKYRVFGWEVEEVNGHNIAEIVAILDKFSLKREKPFLLIGNTVRGKGISFLENSLNFHYTRLNKILKDKASYELIGDWDAEM